MASNISGAHPNITNSPRKQSPRKYTTQKDILRENVNKFSDCVKHIADQLIFLSQNIVRIEHANNFHKEEIERKLNKRDFHSLFSSEINKIHSDINTKLSAFEDRIKSMENNLDKTVSDIDYKFGEINEKSFRRLLDLQRTVESRPTFDYVDQNVNYSANKIEKELTNKFERKLNDFDCREQIYNMMNRENDNENLVNQVSYCLKQVGEMKKISDNSESKTRHIDKSFEEVKGIIDK